MPAKHSFSLLTTIFGRTLFLASAMTMAAMAALWSSQSRAEAPAPEIYNKEKNFETLTAAEHTAAKAAALTRKLKSLVVCADPGNMPLSNNRREGFQNKIAEVVARAMDTEVVFFWRPYLERGLTRETFENNECQILLDMPFGYEHVLTTEPIYRTTYVFAYRTDKGIDIKSLDDPKLKELKIGVFQHSGLRHLLLRRGISKNVEIHVISHDADLSPEKQPWRQVQKIVDGELDIAGVWGPFAGYVQKVLGQPITIVPVNLMDDQVQLEFDLAIGMRKDDVVLKYMLDNALKKSKDEIAKILADYGVPLVQCSKCIVAGNLPSHGSYYDRFQQASQKRYLEPLDDKTIKVDVEMASPDQHVSEARLEAWLQDGADINVEFENAVLAADRPRAAFLLDKGADINRRNPRGTTALHEAARHRDTALIGVLLDRKADIDALDSDGWTPLMHAVFRNHVPSVKLLAARGANLEATTAEGLTPLALAISEGKFWSARALLDVGAQPSTPTAKDGLTPLMLAATQTRAPTRDLALAQGSDAVAIATDLIARGADVNAATPAGVTALMIAAGHDNAPMIGLLLRVGADPNARSADGKTALDIARAALNEASVKSLEFLSGGASN